MYQSIKKLSFISLALIGGTASAQMNRAELLEQLQVDEHTPIMELNVGQLITLVNTPLATPVCEDFSGFPAAATYPPSSNVSTGTIDFRLDYTGGARTSGFAGYPGMQLMEMVEDGEVVITLPVASDDVFVSLIQAAWDPNEIEYYDANGHSIGVVFTSLYNQLDSIHLPAGGIKTVVIRRPELLIESVCYS
jgi:hypothetical protein